MRHNRPFNGIAAALPYQAPGAYPAIAALCAKRDYVKARGEELRKLRDYRARFPSVGRFRDNQRYLANLRAARAMWAAL